MPDRSTALAKLFVGIGFGTSAGLLAWLLSLIPFVHTVELKTYDLRLRATARPATLHERIALVSIDDDSVRRMSPAVGRWPWPRLVHASLIDFLHRAPARLIVYDVLFTEADRRRFSVGEEEWTGEESDRALAESMARAGNVVLLADVADEGLLDESKNLQPPLEGIPALNQPFASATCMEARPVLVPPIAPLATAARAVGHNFMLKDDDGPVRRTVPFVLVAGRALPSLSLATALAAAGVPSEGVVTTETELTFAGRRIPLFVDTVPSFYGPAAKSCRALIAYRGPTNGTFPDFSFYDLFYSEQQMLAGEKPTVDPATFTDRIVVVGASASGTYDLFTTPFAEGAMNGAEIHANIADSMLEGRSVAPMSSAAGGALIFGIALATGLVGGFATAWVTGAWAAAVVAALVWLGVRLFAAGVWIPLTAPLLAVALVFTGDLAWRYFVEGREKRQIKKLFSRYVAKDVFDRLMADPSLAALGGVRRHMTVLFSDVRGFTAMSEKGTPEDVVRQLNEYFTRMVEVLFERRGTLDKFVGDMVMALFGAPLDDPDHADHAVETALAMSHALDDLNRRWAAEGRPTLDIGIGISTGDMVAGNIGSDTIMSYTVIGDAVNLGARLESLNKEHSTRIIIGEATRTALKGRYDMRPLGSVVVKGKSQPVAIYEVRGATPAPQADPRARVIAPQEVRR